MAAIEGDIADFGEELNEIRNFRIKLEADDGTGKYSKYLVRVNASTVAQIEDAIARTTGLELPLQLDFLDEEDEEFFTLTDHDLKYLPCKPSIRASSRAGEVDLVEASRSGVDIPTPPASPADVMGGIVPGVVVCGRYRLQKELHRGALSTVHEAIDEKTSSEVVLKNQFVTHIAKDAKAVDYFIRESQVLANIESSHCVRLYDFGDLLLNGGDVAGACFSVMEKVSGPSLWELITLKRRTILERLKADPSVGDNILEHFRPLPQEWFSPQEIIAMSLSILEALSDVHQRGIVHRDLKPSTIMFPSFDAEPEKLLKHTATHLTEEDEVLYLRYRYVAMLVGFSIMKTYGSSNPPTSAIERVMVENDPDYCAEELLLDKAATTLSDQYATGVILYELVTGTPWFVPELSKEMKARPQDDPVKRIELRSVHTLPRGFLLVIARAISLDSQKRYGSVSQMLTDARIALKEAARSLEMGHAAMVRAAQVLKIGK
eukprot:CAMPEP_0113912460 /NCGR_PEP_ID=MMETSP0780_2-20120614/28937_1 /TAXON_ID=652834 /ORGANISM="Palpitomonas bilix" /LENGTH=489 /DNA_ID=CAMNT_0000909417 /DNA_START=95 /DNA_END=1564 /DNA_ORIENTATION=+ /assembly_acc=CAM_ASM_000599